MNTNVFVYGLLLPRAEHPAFLDDHEIAFDCFATARDKPGARMYGGVKSVGELQLQSLDAIEGTSYTDPTCSKEGQYRRQLVTVRSLEGEPSEAWVYKMNRIWDPPVPPSSYYVDLILNSYERFGMPEEAYTLLYAALPSLKL